MSDGLELKQMKAEVVRLQASVLTVQAHLLVLQQSVHDQLPASHRDSEMAQTYNRIQAKLADLLDQMSKENPQSAAALAELIKRDWKPKPPTTPNN